MNLGLEGGFCMAIVMFGDENGKNIVEKSMGGCGGGGVVIVVANEVCMFM